MKISVNTKPSYSVYIEAGLLDNITTWLPQAADKTVLVISDDNVAELYGYTLANKINADIITFPSGEQHKSRDTKILIENQMLQKQYGRDTLILSIGGGVVSDMAGFVAATYCRGIDIIHIPTTILAMVDAAIGGKTAVNTPFGKNLIGAFKQPLAVIIDPEVISTLSHHQRSSGWIEAVKHGLIDSPALFHRLRNATELLQQQPSELSPLLAASLAVKCRIVEQDEREQKQRAILNLGHTVAHALEKITDYKLHHGEAVCHGIAVEAKLAHSMNILNDNDFHTIENWYRETGFPPLSIHEQHIPKIIQAMSSDKKSTGKKPRFIFLEKIGKIHRRHDEVTHFAPTEKIESALIWLIKDKQ